MKNSKTFIEKTSIILMSFIIFFWIFGGMSSPMDANNGILFETKNAHLIQENIELKKKYETLTKELDNMEKIVEEIQTYDNQIHNEIVGFDFDTTDFSYYQNKYGFNEFPSQDTAFINIDERFFYSAEMLATQLIKLQETSDFFRDNKYVINYYPTISPIKAKDFIELSSPYGMRMHPIYKKALFHEGIDIAAYKGTPIHATAQGRVIKVLYSKYGYGNRVVIAHKYGFETLYAHMGVIRVKKGQWIKKNQVIGTVGDTGTSTGAHIHYEIHKNGQPRDPLGYFYVDVKEEFLAMK